MDVQCERCRAEYEFDDALVSARGTTVKCTNCGHQFRIRRPDAADGQDRGPDRWLVRTADGRELVFTSLRELQKGILGRHVGRSDMLTRGGGPPRALSAISELEPFFEEAAAAAEKSGAHRPRMASIPPPVPGARPGSIPPGRTPSTTAVGHAFAAAATMPSKRQSSRPPGPAHLPPGGRTPSLRPIAPPTPTPPPFPLKAADAMRPRIDTIRPPSSAVPPPAPGPALEDRAALRGHPVPVAPVLSAGDAPPSEREEVDPEPPSAAPTREYAALANASAAPPPVARNVVAGPPRNLAPAAAQPSARPPPTISAHDIEVSALPAPTVPVRRTEDAFRSAMSSIEEDEVRIPGRPRRVGGWVVALVLLVGAGVLGLAVAKPYLAAKQAAQAKPPLDPRAQQLLDDGERAMSGGDLEAANEDFTKASALAEKDPRVLTDVAHLAAARADVPWLKMKLLAADATDEQKAAKQQLDDLAARARAAADAASTAGPDAPEAVLARIDALRIAGDGSGARALVSKVIGQASQPETAYVLAALDLGEPEPLWPMVIERLRLASAGEGNLGRARAALVYALARSGDAAGAKGELDKLASLARPYPLVGVLRAYVAHAPDAAKSDAGSPKTAASGAAGGSGTVDVASLPKSARGGSGGRGGDSATTTTTGGTGFRGASDPRLLLQQAEGAKQQRDWDRARSLYQSALAQNGSDSEALAGLGDVAHAQHDLAGAAQFYHRALGVNPVYLPALVGLGDVEWESGDKDQAQRTYRDIVDRFPEGTFPGRVKSRANGTPTTGSAAAPSSTDTSSEGTSP